MILEAKNPSEAGDAMNVVAGDSSSVLWHFGLQERARSLLAWGIGATLFATVGWMAVQPDDPLGAVSLVTNHGAVAVALQVAVLTVVVASAATVIIGQRLPDAGVFAVAVGLAVVGLRGGTTQFMLINVAGADEAARSALAWRLAGEGVVWFLFIALAMVTSGLVMRWVVGDRDTPSEVQPAELSLWQLPKLGPSLGGESPHDSPYRWQDGMKAALVSFVVAVIVYRLLATGSPETSVRHGQAYFAVAAACYLGVLVGYGLFPARSALWGCLTPPLLCVVGYLICTMSSVPDANYRDIASVPPSAFFRALPITYISVGTAAAVAGYWSARRSMMMRHFREQEAEAAGGMKTKSATADKRR
jgi:hypothetical protein